MTVYEMVMNKEPQTIEFKQSRHDEYLEWGCGFASAHGEHCITSA